MRLAQSNRVFAIGLSANPTPLPLGNDLYFLPLITPNDG